MAAAAAGVDLRETGGFAKSSGRSFHAGMFLGTVYVETAGESLAALGGGGAAAP